tara:strand:- start:679 stop:1308 length:630 start_codon:yes stop_codon:yes gene_type:complete
MGYEYDSKVNRDLAKTAMSIYTKSHNIEPLNEETKPQEVINEEVVRENINNLLLNYVSDVIILAEEELGREMTDTEINETSVELLNRINSISDEEKVEFVNELAEAHGASMTGMQAAPAGAASGMDGSGMPNAARGRGMGGGMAARPAAAKPNMGMRPTGGGDDFDPSNYSSIQDYLNSPNGFALHGGEGLALVLNYFSDPSVPSMTQG